MYWGLWLSTGLFCKSFTRHAVDKLFSPIYRVRKAVRLEQGRVIETLPVVSVIKLTGVTHLINKRHRIGASSIIGDNKIQLIPGDGLLAEGRRNQACFISGIMPGCYISSAALRRPSPSDPLKLVMGDDDSRSSDTFNPGLLKQRPSESLLSWIDPKVPLPYQTGAAAGPPGHSAVRSAMSACLPA